MEVYDEDDSIINTIENDHLMWAHSQEIGNEKKRDVRKNDQKSKYPGTLKKHIGFSPDTLQENPYLINITNSPRRTKRDKNLKYFT